MKQLQHPFLLLSSYLLFPLLLMAQQTPKATGCICDYMPVCKYDVTKKMDDGKTYRGVKDAKGYTLYYNCDNGELTVKWYTSENVIETDSWYDWFDNTHYIEHYDAGKKYYLHSAVLQKTNHPAGTTWKTEYEKEGKRYVEEYLNMKKEPKLEYNGETYTDIYVLRKMLNVTVSLQEFNNERANHPDYRSAIYNKAKGQAMIECVDYYYAKNKGLVKQENVLPRIVYDDILARFKKDKNSVSPEERQTMEAKQSHDSIKHIFSGKVDAHLLGKWKLEGVQNNLNNSFTADKPLLYKNGIYIAATEMEILPDNSFSFSKIHTKQGAVVARKPTKHSYTAAGDTIYFIPQFEGAFMARGVFDAFTAASFRKIEKYWVERKPNGTTGTEKIILHRINAADNSKERFSEVYIRIKP